jgi:nitroimidazol reductase NimA-like FMN-containing flavoprotein (pyridoxamine 5'-phosphate oxidase superfamily)
MLEIEEMGNEEIIELMSHVDYGHIACSRENHPYVVPIHFSYNYPYIYVYTTEGKKAEIIRENPEVCLQMEEVASDQEWKSVIVVGDAEQISDQQEREKALALIVERNPTLTPAISVRWMDDWVRENIEVIFRITPKTTTGRATVHRLRSPDAIYTDTKMRTD